MPEKSPLHLYILGYKGWFGASWPGTAAAQKSFVEKYKGMGAKGVIVREYIPNTIRTDGGFEFICFIINKVKNLGFMTDFFKNHNRYQQKCQQASYKLVKF